MAVLLRSLAKKEPFAIVAGRKDKAQIIMARVLQHIFDNEIFYKQLELDANMPLDRLRKERSKDHIIWRGGGSIRTFSAGVRSKKMVIDSLTGFGSPNIIEDESALIDDDFQAMVLRMLGGHKDNFLLKIGNPFKKNHFFRTSLSSKYHNLFIDYKQALAEGRYSEEFIDEMKDYPFFDILYECKFPNDEDITPDGYRKLIPLSLLEESFITQEEFDTMDKGRLVGGGGDFAGGGDRNAYVLRWENVMRLESTNQSHDTMTQVNEVMNIIDKYEMESQLFSVDYGGLGQGIGDRLHEKESFVNLINFGQGASDSKRFQNERASMYYNLFIWLKNGGRILKDDNWYELLYINYKEDTERRFKIQPKDELKRLMREGGLKASSPDVADAGALTFASQEFIGEDDFSFV